MIVVLGHPRSGTGFMAGLLAAGYHLDVKHERMGTDGISAFQWAAGDTEEIWGCPAREVDLEQHRVIQVVRDPFKCIMSSAYVVSEESWTWMRRHIDLPTVMHFSKLELAAMAVCRWNELIAPQTHDLVRLESVEEDVQRIFGPFKHTVMNVDRNGRNHPLLSQAAVWQRLRPEVQSELASHCVKYGYVDHPQQVAV